ncbi:MAG: ribonuclease P protein component [Rhizobiales bacterium 65-9]|nr:MAG: ribonuclease P protein component [Rhizobiales bacterium 65-9]
MTGFGKLTRRADFTAARKGRRAHAATLTAQIARRMDGSAGEGPRVGLTVTKKIGGAVARNRIKRRLRAAVRAASADAADAACDHVLIAKREALTAPFKTLARDVAAALVSRPRRKASDSSPAGV